MIKITLYTFIEFTLIFCRYNYVIYIFVCYRSAVLNFFLNQASLKIKKLTAPSNE